MRDGVGHALRVRFMLGPQRTLRSCKYRNIVDTLLLRHLDNLFYFVKTRDSKFMCDNEKAGTAFPLYVQPQKEWLDWAPKIPIAPEK
jgi:hypothetical protein